MLPVALSAPPALAIGLHAAEISRTREESAAPIKASSPALRLSQAAANQNQYNWPKQPAPPPNQDITQLKLGRAAFEARDFNGALEAFHRFALQRPNNLAVHFWLGTTLSALGQEKEAEKEYASCIDLAASVGLDSAEMRNNLGNTLIREGYIKEPLFDYKRAVYINPRSAPPYLGLAKCLIETGSFDEALIALNDYEKAGGQDINAMLLRGLALAGKDQYAPAREYLTKFLTAAQNGGYNQPLDKDMTSFKAKYVTTGSANPAAVDLAQRILYEMQQRN
jgi:tetratricopeptide (TPR) repeat protein